MVGELHWTDVLVSKFIQIGGLVCSNQIFGMVCWLVSQPR